MFTAALFTIAKIWKPPKCAATEEWLRKMWCIYTMEYYSAIKKIFLLFAATWIDLKGILPSEINQTGKGKYCMLLLLLLLSPFSRVRLCATP